jgi:microcystin-dependent protein
MADPFVGEIRIAGFNFNPKGWAECDGQLMAISQNTALFSLLGTFYGGDGKSTFALPNLQGRVAIAPGQGPGLSLHDLGETGGSDTVALIASEIPPHPHNAMAYGRGGNSSSPANAAWATDLNDALYATASNTAMSAQATSVAGSSLPHDNHMPYLVLNYIIALQGVYPPRS